MKNILDERRGPDLVWELATGLADNTGLQELFLYSWYFYSSAPADALVEAVVRNDCLRKVHFVLELHSERTAFQLFQQRNLESLAGSFCFYCERSHEQSDPGVT